MDGLLTYLYIWPESARLLESLKRANRPIRPFPGVKFTEYLSDKVAGVVARLRHENVVRLAVDADINGLRALIKHGHLRAALNLTTQLLTGAGGQAKDGKTASLFFEIWAIRFQLFVALKMHSALIDELAPFEELDGPETYLQYYADSGDRKGSAVPYSLRLIHAEAAAFGAEPWTAFVRMQRLEQDTTTATSMAQNAGLLEGQVDAWRKRLETVELMKARLFFRLKRYKNVFAICEELARRTTDEARRRELFALLVRISLAVGSSVRLSRYSDTLAKLNSSSEQQVDYQSLKTIFYGNYEHAQQSQSAVTTNPTAMHLNNKAITSFYNGKMDDALYTLCQHTGLLVEPIAVNIGTIADLVTTSSGQLLHKYFADHCDGLPDLIDPESIKITA